MTAWLLLTDGGQGLIRQVSSFSLALGRPVAQASQLELIRAVVNGRVDSDLAQSLHRVALQALRMLGAEYRVQQSIGRIELVTEPLQREVAGSSADLALSLASCLAIGRRLGVLPGSSDQEPLFAATGAVDAHGLVHPVEGLAAKIDAAIAGLPRGCWLFVPAANWSELGPECRQRAQAAGLHLHAVEHFGQALVHLGIPVAGVLIGEPYAALAPYGFAQHRQFFGRETDIRKLQDLLLRREASQQPGALVLGASGVGKSSFCLAGVVPAIQRFAAQAGRPFEFAVWRPREVLNQAPRSDQPLLASVRASWLKADASQTGFSLDAARVASLNDLLAALPQPSGPRSIRIWLVDQLEEVFTQFDTALQWQFGEWLRALQAAGVWVLATLRSDFYARYQGLLDGRGRPVLVEVFGAGGSFDLTGLAGQALRQVIVRPAEIAGCKFEVLPDGRRLDDQIFEDSLRQPHPLPLLSYALHKLWRDRTADHEDGRFLLRHETYRQAGGLAGAIGEGAEQVFRSVGPDAQAALPSVLFALAQPSQDAGAETAVSAPMTTWAAQAPARVLIDALVEHARVLVLEGDAAGQRLRVAHEALFTAWPRAADLLAQSHRHRFDLAQWNGRALHWLRSRKRVGWLQAAEESQIAASCAALGAAAPQDAALDELRRASGKRRLRVRIASGSAMAALVLAAAGFWQWQRSASQAVTEGAVELALQGTASKAAADALVRDALALQADGQAMPWPARVQRLLAAAALEPQGPGLQRLGEAMLQARRLVKAALSEQRCIDVAMRRDGVKLLCVHAGGSIQAWQLPALVPAGPPVRLAGGPVARLLFAERDQSVLALHADGRLALLDAQTFQPTATLATIQGVTAVAMDAPGTRLAIATDDGALQLWGLDTRAVLARTARSAPEASSALQFSPQGGQLAVGGVDGTVTLLDSKTLRPLWRRPLTANRAVLALAFDPAGGRLAAAGEDRRLAWLDTRNGQSLQSLETRHADTVFHLVAGAEGGHLLSAGADGQLLAWQARPRLQADGEPLATGMGRVDALALVPGSALYATASSDKSLRLWTTADTWPGRAPRAPGSGARVVALSADDEWLVSGDDEGTLRLLTPAGAPVCEVSVGAAITAIAVGPKQATDGGSDARHAVFVGRGDGTIGIWSSPGCQRLRTPVPAHAEFVSALSLSPDGSTLASGSWDGALRLWRAADLQPVGAPLLDHRSGVLALAFSADGQQLASGGGDGTLRLRDALSGQPSLPPIRHPGPVAGLAYAGDLRAVITGSSDQHLRRFSMTTGEPLGEPVRLRSAVEAVAASGDGATIAATTAAGPLALWQPGVWPTPSTSVLPGAGRANAVALNRNGSILVTASDQTLRLWPGPALWMAAACQTLAVPALDAAVWQALAPRLPQPRPCGPR